jgi:positive regulator of sigma E activity
MTRQVHTQQGRVLNPWKTVLFVSALLTFIFTVIYRMVKSASFSNAVAALVESLLIVFFFILFGILLAYLLYFIYQRVHQGSGRQQAYNMFDFSSGRKEPACKPDCNPVEFAPDDEIKPSPDSA